MIPEPECPQACSSCLQSGKGAAEGIETTGCVRVSVSVCVCECLKEGYGMY